MRTTINSFEFDRLPRKLAKCLFHLLRRLQMSFALFCYLMSADADGKPVLIPRPNMNVSLRSGSTSANAAATSPAAPLRIFMHYI